MKRRITLVAVMAMAVGMLFSACKEEVDRSEPGWVDLGLPSGRLWATCNVGAASPEKFGDYFAWGEVVTKTTYSWSTYKHCHGANNMLTKYCPDTAYGYLGFSDNLTILVYPEDDAAAVNTPLAAGAHMPTEADWRELMSNTTCTWTVVNKVAGCQFTAENGNSIFLPATGDRLYDELTHAGGYGYYWSCSLDEGRPTRAQGFYFMPAGQSMYSCSRNVGQSVRAVR